MGVRREEVVYRMGEGGENGRGRELEGEKNGVGDFKKWRRFYFFNLIYMRNPRAHTIIALLNIIWNSGSDRRSSQATREVITLLAYFPLITALVVD